MSRIAFLNAFAFLLILCNAATATTTKATAKHKEPLANMLERNLYALDAAIAMASDESNLSNARSARNIKETAAETLTEEVNKATTTTTSLSDAEVTQLIQMISFPTENVIKPKEQMAVEMEPRTAHGQTALAAVPVANDGTRHRRNVANDVSDDNEQHGYYVIAFENPNAAESGVPYSKLDIIPAAEQHRRQRQRQRRDKRANIATTTTTTADDGNNKLLQVPNDVEDNDDDDDDDDGVDEDYNDDNDVDVDEDDDNVAATSARTFNMRQLNRYVRRLMRQLSRGTRQVKRKTKRVKHIDEELTVENFLKGLYATQLKQREKQKQSSSIAGWLGSWLT